MNQQQIAIVGFGGAGFHGVKGLREAGFAGDVHVYTNTALPPSNPMLTTYYTAGKLPYEGMFPFGTLEDLAQKYNLHIHTSTSVSKLDAPAHRLLLSDGTGKVFDKILLATGADAFVPPIGDYPRNSVFVMRTPDDATKLKAYLQTHQPQKGVVVGASMAGIKVAEVLRGQGIACTLADMAPSLFPLAALPEVSAEIANRVQKKGVELRFGLGLSSITQQGDGLLMQFGEEQIAADFAVLCIGTRTALAYADPKELHINRGIVVNCNMETSVPGIYAAGDCCEGRDIQLEENRIIGLWANAAYQGHTAGSCMAGREVAFAGNIVHNITHFFDMDFIGLGDNRSKGQVLSYRGTDGFYFRAIANPQGLQCVNILDNHYISGVLKSFMLKCLAKNNLPLSQMQQVALLKSGLPKHLIERLNEGCYE